MTIIFTIMTVMIDDMETSKTLFDSLEFLWLHGRSLP